MSQYIHFTNEQKEQARQTDLVSLLESQGETLKRSGKEFEWKDGSAKVTVRGNLWYHQYDREGGDAIDFVRRFYDKSYPEAVEFLLGGCGGTLITSPPVVKEVKPFELPPKNDTMRRVYAYLIKHRCIDSEVLNAFVRANMIYESADYHNAVFVGYDKDGVPRHAHKRGTGQNSKFKGNIDSCSPEYSFLCFDTEIDAEKFCNEKSAIFVIMPEENPNTFFMISLIIQQLYREILAVADENGGKLKNRCVFFADEFGTLPKIESAEMMFSASRSRRLQIVPIIQSFSQLDKNYGKEGAEIIVDNTQITLFGGFAPNSSSAETLSKALGSRTVMSGSVSRSKNDPSQSLQMIERPLMTPDELKSMPKGQFVVMKTGFHPMKVKLKLFFKWGIKFNEDKPYTIEDNGGREVEYAEKKEIIDGIVQKYHADWLTQEETSEKADSAGGQNQAKSQSHDPQRTPPQNPTGKKNGDKGSGMRPVAPNNRTTHVQKQEVKPDEPT